MGVEQIVQPGFDFTAGAGPVIAVVEGQASFDTFLALTVLHELYAARSFTVAFGTHQRFAPDSAVEVVRLPTDFSSAAGQGSLSEAVVRWFRTYGTAHQQEQARGLQQRLPPLSAIMGGGDVWSLPGVVAALRAVGCDDVQVWEQVAPLIRGVLLVAPNAPPLASPPVQPRPGTARPVIAPADGPEEGVHVVMTYAASYHQNRVSGGGGNQGLQHQIFKLYPSVEVAVFSTCWHGGRRPTNWARGIVARDNGLLDLDWIFDLVCGHPDICAVPGLAEELLRWPRKRSTWMIADGTVSTPRATPPPPELLRVVPVALDAIITANLEELRQRRR